MPHPPETRLILTTHQCRIWIYIQSRHPKGFRRQIALQIFRRLKPVLRILKHAYLNHDDNHFMSFPKAFEDGFQGRGFVLSPEHPGLKLRLERLKLGLTVREAADRSGIHFSHLSLVETGRKRPRTSTILKLEQVYKLERQTKAMKDK
jgi:hypothetical protein